MNAKSDRCDRPAFSLIELVVVMVLMAILASVATVSVRGVIVRQRLSRAAEIVEQFDTALRRQARQERRRVVGVIDRSQGRLIVGQLAAGQPDQNSRRFQLPSQVTVDSIRLGNNRFRNAATPIVANGDGSSPSYAIRLASGKTRRWVFLVGGTGQVVHGLSSASVDQILGIR